MCNERNEMKKNTFANAIHFIITLALFIASWFTHCAFAHVEFPLRYNLFVFVIYVLLLYFFSKTYNCYMLGYEKPGMLIYSQCITVFICTAGSYIGVSVILNHWYTPWMFVVCLALQVIWNVIWSIVATKIFFIKNPKQKAVVLYTRGDKEDIAEIYEHALFDIDKEVKINETDNLDDIIERVKGYGVIFVIGVPATLRNGIAKHCVEHDIEGYFMPHVGDVIMKGAKHIQAFSVPLQSVSRAKMDIGYAALKRAFDIVFSLVGIIVSSPFMLLVAIAIKCEDGGSVVYKQTRLTKDAKEFKIYKFRSMRENAEADGVARLAAENDDRITVVGRIVRACRMDELPQLFNILKGDMSFVGPRPERPELAKEIEKTVPAFNLRLQVKAGLTGYAQIFGKYNTDPLDKLKMDLMYINKMNPVLDLQLMCATFKILFIKDSTEGIKK